VFSGVFVRISVHSLGWIAIAVVTGFFRNDAHRAVRNENGFLLSGSLFMIPGHTRGEPYVPQEDRRR
jgi:hypothetical protein